MYGGEVAEGMEALTGYPTEVVDFNRPGFDSEATWVRMLSFSAAGFPMGAGTTFSLRATAMYSLLHRTSYERVHCTMYLYDVRGTMYLVLCTMYKYIVHRTCT